MIFGILFKNKKKNFFMFKYLDLWLILTWTSEAKISFLFKHVCADDVNGIGKLSNVPNYTHSAKLVFFFFWNIFKNAFKYLWIIPGTFSHVGLWGKFFITLDQDNVQEKNKIILSGYLSALYKI